MKLNFSEYKDKVYACWVGKNIGGTMGAPYEGVRTTLDIKGYATEANVVLPNDDLDLQLVWLDAVKKVGPYGLTAAKLGEFWLDFIVPYWNEYGIGKVNMRRGLYPPLAGDYQNDWKHSNGAWIRTEVWATLAPANPSLAANYAIEDALVDHGAGEGTYAAAFVAILQSAAFVCNDIRKLIDLGLANIPENSRMAQTIRLVLECYDNGVPAMECRERVLELNADIGDGWFEAPSNVGYTVLGLVYGEGDFKKSMITAINCGDDTDCTAATVGATLGIMYGMAGIPKDWQEHIGDTIITKSLNLCTGANYPKTCTQLTEMIVDTAPVMLKHRIWTDMKTPKREKVELTDGAAEIPEDIFDKFYNDVFIRTRLNNLKPYSFEIPFGPLNAVVTYDREPNITPGGTITAHICFENLWRIYGNIIHNLSLRWILPEGYSVTGPKALMLVHHNAHQKHVVEADYVITAGENVEATNRLVLEVVIEGHHTVGYIPLVLLG